MKRPKTFQPDFEIEHTKVSYTPTPFAWVLVVFSALMLAVWVFCNA
jgi:hypothetical protein